MRALRPHIFLFIVNLFYGAGFTVSKLVVPHHISPFGMIMIRVCTTTAMFWGLHYFWLKEKVERKDFTLLALCSLFGVVINQELFFLGLSITSPINASLIMITTPILVFVISFFLAHEEVTPWKIIGLMLGALGAFLIISGKGFNFSSDTLWGDVCILINAMSYAVYLVIVRPLMKKYHPLTAIKWVFAFGLLPTILFGTKQLSVVEWTALSTQTWLAIVFIVIGTTFFAYLLNVLALREVSSGIVGAYIYLQPILATLISISIGQDHITPHKIIAALLIFSGVFLVSFAHQLKLFSTRNTAG